MKVRKRNGFIAPRRIAHCSDIHLDGNDDHGGAACRDAFMRGLKAMRGHRPDILMIAGDLFDSNTATADTIQWAMETLGQQPFPVVMIPGNHDCMEADAIYRRYDFKRIANVDMLASEAGGVVRYDGLGLAVWGKGMVDHSPDYSPLAGCWDRPADCRWYLGMGHGMFVPHGAYSDRSSPIHMREIEDNPCDYLALGHHHAAMELVSDKAAAAYCGSPTDTIGRGATYVIVDLPMDAAPAVTVHAIDLQDR